MYSMTGYGKADYRDSKRAIGIEISSVNNRFLEFMVRMPRELSNLEPLIKEHISEKVQRGKITVCIHYEDFGSGAETVMLNRILADDIFKKANELKKRYKLKGEIELGHFLNFPEIFLISKDSRFAETIWPFIKSALNKALKELTNMRRREGANLKIDLSKRLKALESQIKKIVDLAAKDKKEHKKKLTERINEILDKSKLDNNRLEEEIAYIVDRADITEEAVRFQSHLKQFRNALVKKGPVGKRLNFLLQELNREANTIGSKANNSDIGPIVVSVKEEIEKIREQVQNIE